MAGNGLLVLGETELATRNQTLATGSSRLPTAPFQYAEIIDSTAVCHRMLNYLMATATKSKIIAGHRLHEKDTGSSDVQIAILTDRINHLSYRDWETDRKSTRLNSSHSAKSRMPSSA